MKWQRLFGVAAAVGCGVSVVSAQSKPTLWIDVGSGGTLGSAATTHSDIIKMVFPGPSDWPNSLIIDRTDPEATQYQQAFDAGVIMADAVCARISVELPARVHIHLQGFGAGGRFGDLGDVWADGWDQAPALINHPADRITCGYGPQWKQTPWPERGKAEGAAWMRGFLSRYKENQAQDPTILDPEHLSFEMEATPGCGATNDAGMWGNYVQCLMADDRSGADPTAATQWRYIPVGMGKWQTLAQSYKDARCRFDGDSTDTVLPLNVNDAPEPSAIGALTEKEQILFATWINSIFSAATTDAFDLAVGRVLREYYPDCQFSNYGSVTADGGKSETPPLQMPYVYNSIFGSGRIYGGDPGRPLPGLAGRRFNYDPWTGWSNGVMANHLSVDAPVFYWLEPAGGWVSYTEPESSYFDKFLEYFSQQVDVFNFSEDQVRRHRVVPWILGKGHADIKLSSIFGAPREFTFNRYRDMFAIGRAKGIKDYMIFDPIENTSNADKAEYDAALGDVFQPEIACVSANVGTIISTGDLAALLSESDGKTLNVTSTAFGVQAANFNVHFRVPAGFNPAKLKIVVEGHTTFDSATPAGISDTNVAARAFQISTGSQFTAPYAVHWASTPVPQTSWVVLSDASDFIISGNSCGGAGNEIAILIGAQTDGSSVNVNEPFTLHIDNIRVYGYE